MSSTSTAVARESLPNSTTTKLGASKTFTGVSDSVGGFTKVGVAVMANVEIELIIYQGGTGVFWDKVTTYTIPATSAPEPRTAFECPRVVTALTHRFFYITARNTSLVDASFTRIHSQVFNDGYLDSSNDSVMCYGVDENFSSHQLLTDASGALIVKGEVVFPESQDVVVTSAPHLSYLTDNIAVATQPALAFATDKVDATGSSVSISSAPHLSYLTDNVAVATMPPITGSVSVTSAPYLSYLTSNIAVATQPALAFATDKVDATGSSVSISSAPYLSKTTSSIDISGQSVVVPYLNKATSSIDISGQSVVTSHTTSSVTSWENPTSIISFDSGNTVRQIKGNAGSLHSLAITNDNNALAYVALYDALAIDVTAGATTPKAVFTINKNQQIQLPLHSVAFSTAISFFTATSYNGGIPLTSVYLTASYNG